MKRSAPFSSPNLMFILIFLSVQGGGGVAGLELQNLAAPRGHLVSSGLCSKAQCVSNGHELLQMPGVRALRFVVDVF